MESKKDTKSTAVWRDSRAVALLLAATLTVMANAAISPALPGLQKLFSDDPNAAVITRMLVTAPSLSIAFLAPLAGLTADILGRRRLMLAGMLLFAIAGSAGLYMPDLQMIFLSRIILGIAVAMIMTAQTALIGDYFAGAERNALTGLQISARNFGGLMFILLSGWFATSSPRLPFAVYGFALLILPFAYKVVKEPKRAPKQPSHFGRRISTDSAWRLKFAGLIFVQALTNMVFFIMPTQLPFFIDAKGFESSMMTGAILGVLMLTGGCVALVYSRINRVVGYSGIYALGYGAMAAGFVLLVAPMTLLTFLGASLVGAGYALVSPSFVSAALLLAPEYRRGLASGALTASVFVGQFFSPLISTPIILGFGFSALFLAAALLGAILAAVGAAIMFVQLLSNSSVATHT